MSNLLQAGAAAPPAPSAVVPPEALPGQGGPALARLEARQASLQAQINAGEAQRAVLMEKMRTGSEPIRVSAEQQLLRVDLDLADARAELASVDQQIAARGARQGRPVIVQPARGGNGVPFLDRVDPDAITAVFVLTSLAILIPLSIGLARRLWRRPVQAPSKDLEEKVVPRLDRLEQAVDAIAIEVERISEGQRFVTKVLSERPLAVSSAEVAEQALGEAKPFLALGAGPIEPIKVAERQAVKQMITPH